MPDTQHYESITFRLDRGLKAELADLASRDRKSLGALLRDIARDRINAEHHHSFEWEASRQSRAAAKLARKPGTDERAVMREIEAELGEFGGEWK